MNTKILMVAAEYLRTTDHPFAAAMADTCAEAAGFLTAPAVRRPGSVHMTVTTAPRPATDRPRRPNGTFVHGPVNGVAPKPAPPTAAPVISDENIRILLHAGGYKQAKRKTVAAYRLMLTDTAREWTGADVAKQIGGNPGSFNTIMAEMARRGVTTKTRYAHYRAT